MNLNSLQIGRPLKNTAEFLSWATATLAPNTVFQNPHATIAYSRAKVDWEQDVFQPHNDELVVSEGERGIKVLDGNVLVLTFQSSVLQERWAELVHSGASWDFSGYLPHVTMGKLPAGFDFERTGLFMGELIFGPEYRKVAKA